MQFPLPAITGFTGRAASFSISKHWVHWFHWAGCFFHFQIARIIEFSQTMVWVPVWICEYPNQGLCVALQPEGALSQPSGVLRHLLLHLLFHLLLKLKVHCGGGVTFKGSAHARVNFSKLLPATRCTVTRAFESSLSSGFQNLFNVFSILH